MFDTVTVITTIIRKVVQLPQSIVIQYRSLEHLSVGKLLGIFKSH